MAMFRRAKRREGAARTVLNRRSAIISTFLSGSLCLLAGPGLTQTATCSNVGRLVFAWDPIRVPKPSNLCRFVKDEAAAIRLGKAWFWDMQVGSDGVTACASCHFHAGSDSRVKNQLSPHGTAVPGTKRGFEIARPNGTVTAGRFPFHKLQDPENRHSPLISDSNDVMSSQGVHRTRFVDIVPGQAAERVTVLADPVFNVGGTNTRQVEPRQTMNVINAVFNIEQFWDGRGKFYFNGVNPFGLLDPNARILEKQGTSLGASVSRVKVEIDRASLASQAVGPPTSATEMSAAGRPFPKIGKKLLTLTPLARQVVHPSDSVLGSLSRDSGALDVPGLSTTYDAMIRAAFNDAYWASDKKFDLAQNVIGTGAPANTNQYTLMEMNTSLFWGLAIQAYTSTLVSDASPFDQFMAGNQSALTAEEKVGKDIFLARCANCHKLPEINKATIDHMITRPTGIDRIVERMPMAKGGALENAGVYDGGFYNAGVRPTAEDLGRGGTVSIPRPGGSPLTEQVSFTRRAQQFGEAVNRIPSPRLSPPLRAGEGVAVAGAFRVPTLRNAELTGPYYHHGGMATLRDVVMFYVRGGDFRETNIDVLDNGIGKPGFVNLMLGRDDLQQALAKFMARPLTDQRVRFERAPFDHPQLFVPNGHPGNETSVTNDGRGLATDTFLTIPPVGAAGRGTALKTFLNLPPEQISR